MSIKSSEIVRRGKCRFALADQIMPQFAKAKAQVVKLTPVLVARTFVGKLVSQDPADEAASALLKKVQTMKGK